MRRVVEGLWSSGGTRGVSGVLPRWRRSYEREWVVLVKLRAGWAERGDGFM
jgi:hypothetical protein